MNYFSALFIILDIAEADTPTWRLPPPTEFGTLPEKGELFLNERDNQRAVATIIVVVHQRPVQRLLR